MFIATIDPVLGIIIAGAISAFGAYLVAAKKMSGAVRSSDAEQLWTESRSIREWSADRISQLTNIIGSLEIRVKGVEERNLSLLHENERLLNTIDELRKALSDCRSAVDSLTKQLIKSEQKSDDLIDEAIAKETP